MVSVQPPLFSIVGSHDVVCAESHTQIIQCNRLVLISGPYKNIKLAYSWCTKLKIKTSVTTDKPGECGSSWQPLPVPSVSHGTLSLRRPETGHASLPSRDGGLAPLVSCQGCLRTIPSSAVPSLQVYAAGSLSHSPLPSVRLAHSPEAAGKIRDSGFRIIVISPTQIIQSHSLQ